MTDKLDIILNACKRIAGTDFTVDNRKQDNVYFRACFYRVAKDKLVREDKKRGVTLQKLGDIAGNRNHATVLHALKQTEENGSYLLLPNVRKILNQFRKEVESISTLKTAPEIDTYTSDLLNEIEALKKENSSLLCELYDKPAKEPDSEHQRFFKRLLNISEGMLLELEETRFNPWIKMNGVHNLNVKFDEVSYN